LRRSLEKVVIENRGTSAQPPGDTLVSLALVAGLVANLEEALPFALTAPYAFWVRVLDESTRLPLRGATVLGEDVTGLAREMIAIARRGLVLRGEPDADRWLGPLLQRLDEGVSPAEHRLEELRNGGTAEIVRRVRL
jgi:gamma-glutamylcysteine synthetase